jgi:glutamyl endopeptidase
MSQHEAVASEELEAMDAEVYSESVAALEEDGEDLVAEDFSGLAWSGALESAPGFNTERALLDGVPATPAEISEEEAALVAACEEEFEGVESVCGNDDRVRISPATSLPWRWNCQLIVTRADGSKSRCTGFFIGPHTVMTAGHCVYSHSAGGWARSIEVIPGMDAGSRPFGSQIATSFRSVVGWTGSQKAEYDYGAIILPNDKLGKTVGWFGFAALSDSSLKNLLVNNAGYAGDKPYGTLWFNAGRITRVEARRLYYMLDTYGGHSGSPTWRLRDGQRHVVGVHAYGGCPNKSTRITRAVFNNMLSWRK